MNLHLESNYEFFSHWKERHHRSPWKRLIGNIVKRTARKTRTALIESLTEVILCLKNVTVLHVRSCEQLMHDYSAPVFAAAWRTFGARLCLLSIEGNLNCFQHPLSLAPFTQPLDLRLEFTDISSDREAPTDAITLRDVIGPAINRLSPVLLRLRISLGVLTRGHLDLSPLLTHLEPLPHLESLTMHVPLHKLVDPSGLSRILSTHASSLHYVDLHFRMSTPDSDISLSALMAGFQVTYLRSFTFRPASHGGFDAMVAYLLRSAHTLARLTILDRFLSPEEVAVIVSILGPSHSLHTLSLNVEFCDPHLLALLATTFPGLERLSLCILQWGGDCPDSSNLWDRTQDCTSCQIVIYLTSTD